MQSWIQEQALRKSSTFDFEMENQPSSSNDDYTQDPEKYFFRVCKDCNYLDAAQMVQWDNYLKPHSKVLDLAGGTGWLTGFLSSKDDVESVTIVDASKKYLEDNLPVSVKLTQGRFDKVTPIEGHFSPLLLDDQSFDHIVVSSLSFYILVFLQILQLNPLT